MPESNEKKAATPATTAVPPAESAPAAAAAAPESTQAPAKDKVGDILRKERLTRRITVETIAKDLRLNAAYIKALEASEYASLPADPYVRVYIKSLTKYLSLDSDAIMKEFYIERGLISEDKEGSNKIDVSVKKTEQNPAIVVAISLAVAVIIFVGVAMQNGWIISDNQSPAASSSIEEKDDTSPQENDTTHEDGLIAAMAGNPDTVIPTAKKAP